jgi:hypothetical protein
MQAERCIAGIDVYKKMLAVIAGIMLSFARRIGRTGVWLLRRSPDIVRIGAA